MNFVMIMLAVMCGTMLATFMVTGIMLVVMKSKRFMKWYINFAMRIGKEMTDGLEDAWDN